MLKTWELPGRRIHIAKPVSALQINVRRPNGRWYQVPMFVHATVDDDSITELRLSAALRSAKCNSANRQRTASPVTDIALDREPLDAPRKRRSGCDFDAARAKASLSHRAYNCHLGAHHRSCDLVIGRGRDAKLANSEARIIYRGDRSSDQGRSAGRKPINSRSDDDPIIASETAHINAISDGEIGQRARP
jgi:hypothetical protein